MEATEIQVLQEKLLDWYNPGERAMPWRAMPGEIPNPYYVWLSEVMLQQTTVGTVKSYFNAFIHRWPTLKDFSKAPLEDVLHAWQGLGYYTRARSLVKCAAQLMENYNGEFPNDPKILIKLSGIGPYSAASIASIAFDYPIVPVDGNVVRVFARLGALKDPVDDLKKTLPQSLENHAPKKRAGDFAQALMDLGATVCTPSNPSCEVCPIQSLCKAFKLGQVDSFPVKSPKPEKQKLYTIATIFKNKNGEILLRQNPPQGLLANLWGVPTSPWVPHAPEKNKSLIRHVFTHIDLSIKVAHEKNIDESQEGVWVHPKDLHQYPLSTMMKKILRDL